MSINKSGIIKIKDLRVNTIIGVYDKERTTKQDIIINVTIITDISKACISDNIEDTYDYDTISKDIIKEVKSTSFMLLEKLAAHILEMILADNKVINATVEIDKPEAVGFSKSVSITVSGGN